MAALVGSILTGLTWILGADLHPWLRGLGTALLIATIPLLIFSGYCLDWMEQRKTREASKTGGIQQRKCISQMVTGALLILMLVQCGASSKAQAQKAKVASTAAEASSPSATRTTDFHKTSSGSLENEKPAEASSALSAELMLGYANDRERSLGQETDTQKRDAVELKFWRTNSSQQGVSESTVPIKSSPTPENSPLTSSQPQWYYGGFIDVAYLLDFNHPVNHLFRSRGTAFRVDNVVLNMAGFYVRKKASEQSRWGLEATAHAGKDAEFFGFSATAPNISGYKVLRQLGPTNVSYLAPAGKGLTLQAGIFPSLIGYDSLYAKDNLNYTRPWGADFTPYFMMGGNASYPFKEKVTGTFFVVNGYWHLARANNVPSLGGQIAYKVNSRVTLKETVLFGPHQSNTSFKFWRFLTDTIVERKTDRVTLAFEYTYSQERLDAPATSRALMMSSQVPLRWTMNNRLSLSFRPEVFWDRDGRWTLARQTVKAFTTTLEYRLPFRWTNTIFRLEHRFDDSRGPDGGFFRGRELQPGVVGLTPNQHLLIFATTFTFDR